MDVGEREDDGLPPSKRGRYDDEAQADGAAMVREDIMRLGEQSKVSLQDSIERLADFIMREIGDHADVIVDALVDCAATKPDRTTAYTTLVGLINAAAYDTGHEVVMRLSARLQEALEGHDFAAAASLVRFVADLGNASVLVPNSVVGLLEALVAVGDEVGVSQLRTDVYVTMALEVLPWVGRDLAERAAEPFAQLLHAIESYVARRSTAHVRHYAVLTTDNPEQIDSLELAWAQVSGLQKREWKETAITRPYIFFDDVLVTSSQHELPAVSVPPHAPDHPKGYPAPRVVTRLFTPSDVPEDCTLPPSRSAERMIYDAKIRETFYAFQDNVGQCASEVAEYIYSMRRVPLNFLAAEVLLGEMLVLPSPRAPLPFYHALLAELVRTTAPFADAVALAMDVVFHRLGRVDVEAASGFALWVAHFLNYYGFKFRWELWFEVVALAPDHQQAVFVREALSAMVELSYLDCLRKAVPAQLEPMLPDAPEPQFKYEAADAATRRALMIEEVCRAIRNKKLTVAEVAEVVNSITEIRKVTEIGASREGGGGAAGAAAANGDGDDDDDVGDIVNMYSSAADDDAEDAAERLAEQRLEVYFSCVLHVGCKTMTHLRVILQRQRDALAHFVTTPDQRGLVMRVAAGFWAKSPQMLRCAVGNLFRNGTIDAATVVDWVFSPAQVERFSLRFVWDVLFDTLDLCGRAAASSAASGSADADANARRCQDALVLVLQHFSAVLGERVAPAGEEQKEHRGWTAASLGRFHQLCRRYCRAPFFRDAMPTVEAAILPDLHPSAAETLKGVVAMEA